MGLQKKMGRKKAFARWMGSKIKHRDFLLFQQKSGFYFVGILQ
jgi:hypothetical protein